MKAILAPRPGGPEVLEIAEMSRPRPGTTDILVKVHAAGVNRPDVVQREGKYPPPPGASQVLGLEMAGTVEAAGPAVTRFKAGDKVMGLVAGGGYAQWCVVDETNALPVPDNMDMVEAAAVPETYFTVWSNLFQRAGLKPGETVLIHGGTSGIGTTAIQLAKAFGSRVLTTVGSAQKVEAARKLGADLAINYREEDFVAAARTATDNRGPDVILDMVGGEYIQRNIEVAAADGRIAQIAFLNGARNELNLLPLMLKRLTLTGSTLRARTVEMKADVARELEEKVLPLLAEGKVRPVIDSVFPFDQVRQAHERIGSHGHIGKVVLTFP